jgi:hypothetical protein
LIIISPRKSAFNALGAGDEALADLDRWHVKPENLHVSMPSVRAMRRAPGRKSYGRDDPASFNALGSALVRGDEQTDQRRAQCSGVIVVLS